ncbi:MAG: NADH-quinone oxidoreductase subunit NuoE [Pseudomonadales bacterium]|jgi:NADH-quinone oxidoreductase subunit E|nr:NADH-quinone oxidoreductase subunit NuoE [Pseudomonadales bacterium]MDP6472699.1 NADH-quinone oxidoreductase subunit NuoE [Pseudomonadales bacterium]MDP6827910.1 NADH-quinone oxidoreductase subunit NuoE [Pseudomonadales bacterium]MDP6973506.1 NADH-quinone oxidoreductase subunit NuoE [Pseudomonadales bacterium]
MSEPAFIDVLSQAEIDAIEIEVAHLPDRPSAAIDALLIVQKHRGWVSDESLAAIARLLGMSAADLDSIATFYNLIYRKPVGRHVVMVCDSVSCYVMGGESLMMRIRRHLGIEPGETTEDGRYTLLPCVCLGACDRAPVIMVDDQLAGPLAESDVEDVLGAFE